MHFLEIGRMAWEDYSLKLSVRECKQLADHAALFGLEAVQMLLWFRRMAK
jgi:hypothetical protein